MGGSSKPKPPPKPAPIATPSEADTAQVTRSSQQDEIKRKKRQQTVFSSGNDFGSKNVLG